MMIELNSLSLGCKRQIGIRKVYNIKPILINVQGTSCSACTGTIRVALEQKTILVKFTPIAGKSTQVLVEDVGGYSASQIKRIIDDIGFRKQVVDLNY